MSLLFVKLIAFSPLFYTPINGLVTNISVIQIPSWFFALTPFEAIFVGLTFLWMCMLGVTGILPLNLNNFFYGSPSGRKRKRRQILNSNFDGKNSSLTQHENLTGFILDGLRHLDEDQCVPRTLCELEHQILLKNYSPPRAIHLILSGLKLVISKNDSALSNFDAKKVYLQSALDPFKFYANAVHAPYSQKTEIVNQNFTICSSEYASCQLTNKEILSYVSSLHFDDFL